MLHLALDTENMQENDKNRIAAAFAGARDAINSCPPGRERSLALTKLEESEMWLAKATGAGQADENWKQRQFA